ncbi:hypothetical protein HDU76_001190 [Blyttiomyces sp. JEL0837]|nr:hypothetical protein HDU76_001190 [Blyttiomyces sp. JEL0837]
MHLQHLLRFLCPLPTGDSSCQGFVPAEAAALYGATTAPNYNYNVETTAVPNYNVETTAPVYDNGYPGPSPTVEYLGGPVPPVATATDSYVYDEGYYYVPMIEYAPDPVVDCTDIDDYAPVCVSKTQYQYCLRQTLIKFQVSINCDKGLVCCPSQSSMCVDPSTCPELLTETAPIPNYVATETINYNPNPPQATATESGPSYGGNNGNATNVCETVLSGYACVSNSQFAQCDGYQVAATFDCASSELVCCAKTGLCDWPYNCA